MTTRCRCVAIREMPPRRHAEAHGDLGRHRMRVGPPAHPVGAEQFASVMPPPPDRLPDAHGLHRLGDVVHAQHLHTLPQPGEPRRDGARRPAARRPASPESRPTKPLRETPSSTAQPSPWNSDSRRINARLCARVLPKPIPGSTMMRPRGDSGSLRCRDALCQIVVNVQQHVLVDGVRPAWSSDRPARASGRPPRRRTRHRRPQDHASVPRHR